MRMLFTWRACWQVPVKTKHVFRLFCYFCKCNFCEFFFLAFSGSYWHLFPFYLSWVMPWIHEEVGIFLPDFPILYMLFAFSRKKSEGWCEEHNCLKTVSFYVSPWTCSLSGFLSPLTINFFFSFPSFCDVSVQCSRPFSSASLSGSAVYKCQNDGSVQKGCGGGNSERDWNILANKKEKSKGLKEWEGTFPIQSATVLWNESQPCTFSRQLKKKIKNKKTQNKQTKKNTLSHWFSPQIW